jgi:hypothetical protein
VITPAAAAAAALLVLAGISRTPPAPRPPPDVLGALQRAVEAEVGPPPVSPRPPSPVPLPVLKPTAGELLCETAAELATDPTLQASLGGSGAGRELLEALWRTLEGCAADDGNGRTAARGPAERRRAR